jgi:hypothetical protein
MSQEWKFLFEQCYESISKAERIKRHDSMRRLYLWDKDYAKASMFLPASPEQPEELADAMDIYLRLERYEDAGVVAKLCQERLYWTGDEKIFCSAVSRRDNNDPHPVLKKALEQYQRAMAERQEKLREQVYRFEEWAVQIGERWAKAHKLELDEGTEHLNDSP